MTGRSDLLAVLVVTVALAGCTVPFTGGGNGGGGGGPAVTRTDGLSVDMSLAERRLPEDERVIVTTTVRNTGQAQATDIDASLFGGGFTQNSNVLQGPPSALAPVDAAAGVPGERATVEWAISPPGIDVGTGSTEEFTVGVQIAYDYSTRSDADISFVNHDDFDGSAGPVSMRHSGAPVHATVETNSPVLLYGSAREGVSVPIRVRNVGPGEVAEMVTVAPSFPTTGQASVDGCSPDEDPRESGVQVELLEGARTVNCRITFPDYSGPGAVASRIDAALRVDLSYRYETQQRTTVTFEGIPG